MAIKNNDIERSYEYKCPEKLVYWLRLSLYLFIAISIVSFVSYFFEYQLLSDFQNDIYSSQEQASDDAEASDFRRSVIAIAYIIVYVISGVLTLKWVYRSNNNVRALGENDLKITPRWAVGWFFVPFANLWKPYEAMFEIWIHSKSLSNKFINNKNSIVINWWGLCLASQLTTRLAINHFEESEEVIELMNSSLIYMFSDVLEILLSFITLSLVIKINSMQETFRTEQVKN